MAVSKKQRLVIEQRRQKVSELALKSLSQAEIAAQLGVTQPTVSNDLKQVRELWRDSGIRDFELGVAMALRRLDLVEREAWEAWERSQKPAQSAVIVGEGVSQPARKTLRNQNGDPRYLALVLRCEEARRALLALDAPRRTEPADFEGRPVTIANILEHIEKHPPPRPTSFDEHPSNVMDVEAVCRQLLELGPQDQETEGETG